jgi:hypothetical protein
MKVATVSIAGKRRVGLVIDDGRSFTPFALPLAEAQDGVLALVRRDGRDLPPALSPISLVQVVIEAPIPAPRRNIFCVINDVTARDLQARYSQWLIGRSQDTFCPMGPYAVTRDEIDIGDTPISCYVNGELRQNSNTRLLIFDIPTIIETLSAGITLQPGDVIATGTPAGVGIGFSPPRYLKNGDVVRIEIGGIGVLENEIVERSA